MQTSERFKDFLRIFLCKTNAIIGHGDCHPAIVIDHGGDTNARGFVRPSVFDGVAHQIQKQPGNLTLFDSYDRQRIMSRSGACLFDGSRKLGQGDLDFFIQAKWRPSVRSPRLRARKPEDQ